VLVDNRAGAAGLIAARAVALARPDGHTLACSHAGFVRLHAVDDQNSALNGLRPIAKLSRSGLVVTVGADAAYRRLRELAAAVQGRRGGVSDALAGIGSPADMAVLRLVGIAGRFGALHIPYKSAPEGELALTAGDVDFYVGRVGPVAAALPWLRSGRVRALAVTSRQRLPMMLSVATAMESGVPDFVVEPCVGLAAAGPNRTRCLRPVPARRGRGRDT